MHITALQANGFGELRLPEQLSLELGHRWTAELEVLLPYWEVVVHCCTWGCRVGRDKSMARMGKMQQLHKVRGTVPHEAQSWANGFWLHDCRRSRRHRWRNAVFCGKQGKRLALFQAWAWEELNCNLDQPLRLFDPNYGIDERQIKICWLNSENETWPGIQGTRTVQEIVESIFGRSSPASLYISRKRLDAIDEDNKFVLKNVRLVFCGQTGPRRWVGCTACRWGIISNIVCACCPCEADCSASQAVACKLSFG